MVDIIHVYEATAWPNLRKTSTLVARHVQSSVILSGLRSRKYAIDSALRTGPLDGRHYWGAARARLMILTGFSLILLKHMQVPGAPDMVPVLPLSRRVHGPRPGGVVPLLV
jgi:hypothetical protein